jgi:hypothetical protein
MTTTTYLGTSLFPGEGRGPGGRQPWTPAFAGERKVRQAGTEGSSQ